MSPTPPHPLFSTLHPPLTHDPNPSQSASADRTPPTSPSVLCSTNSDSVCSIPPPCQIPHTAAWSTNGCDTSWGKFRGCTETLREPPDAERRSLLEEFFRRTDVPPAIRKVF